jgi:hypothetical protein
MKLRFAIRDLLWLLALVAVLLAWRFTRPTPVAGRYQLVPRPGMYPMMIDTATGRIWWQDNENKWIEKISPAVN